MGTGQYNSGGYPCAGRARNTPKIKNKRRSGGHLPRRQTSRTIFVLLKTTNYSTSLLPFRQISSNPVKNLDSKTLGKYHGLEEL